MLSVNTGAEALVQILLGYLLFKRACCIFKNIYTHIWYCLFRRIIALITVEGEIPHRQIATCLAWLCFLFCFLSTWNFFYH